MSTEAATQAVAPPTVESAVTPWRVRLGRVAALFLGLVLLTATLPKVADPMALQELIEHEGLDFLLPANVMVYIVLVIEGGLGLALVLGMRRPWILWPAVLLVLLFVYLTGKTYIQSLSGDLDPQSSCGCFGNLVERSPAQAFWQDLALLVPAMALSFVGRRRVVPFPRRRTIAVGTFCVLLVGFAWAAPGLPLDDFATRLSKDKRVGEICAGVGVDRTCVDTHLPEVEVGGHVVVIADLNDPALAEFVPQLNAYVQGGGQEQVWILCTATEEEQQEWFWTHAPAFEVRMAPLGLLRPMYRRLPRSFRVADGTVTETYDGFPPLKDSKESP